MKTITNNKIDAIYPTVTWNRFVGFSLLFNNPGPTLENLVSSKENTLAILQCDIEHEAHILYRKLNENFVAFHNNLKEDKKKLCALPATTYHVTALDGINADNLNNIDSSNQILIQEIFDGFPSSLSKASIINSCIEKSDLVTNRSWEINFKFYELANFSNKALVALLSPIDKKKMDAFIIARTKTARELTKMFGLVIRPERVFLPHITLAYFSNETYGSKFQGKNLSNLSAKFRASLVADNMQPLEITFKNVDVYGFENMVSFFKLAD